MAKVIEGLYYAESHEYVRVEGNYGYIGITDYAQHALGNVVYVDLPEVDDEVTAGEEFGAVESVKAASDIAVPSVNNSSVKAVSAKRKTALKAMKKYEQRPLKLVSVEQAIAKIKNENAR